MCTVHVLTSGTHLPRDKVIARTHIRKYMTKYAVTGAKGGVDEIMFIIILLL